MSAILIVSRQFQYCPNGFNTVQTVSILSGQFQYCPDGFNSLQTVLILSGQFQNCPESFNIHFLYRGDLRTCSYVATDDLRTFYMSWEVYLRASSGKFLRVKGCRPESFKFLCLWLLSVLSIFCYGQITSVGGWNWESLPKRVKKIEFPLKIRRQIWKLVVGQKYFKCA